MSVRVIFALPGSLTGWAGKHTKLRMAALVAPQRPRNTRGQDALPGHARPAARRRRWMPQRVERVLRYTWLPYRLVRSSRRYEEYRAFQESSG